jgi:predicted ATPase with chaperone activity
MKSKCGTLVIDDFGRQRVSPTELLNRWIVPLERRRDVLDLESGRKFDVPFDQLIIFSTNMTPSDLVDEAFLRRIPYKIDVNDPTEEQFRDVFLRTSRELGVDCRRSSIDYLLARHYRPSGRALRFCHARDLVQHVHNFCDFRGHTLAVTEQQNLDAAVKNYFGKG